MPTIVDILPTINDILNVNNFWYFNIFEQDKSSES